MKYRAEINVMPLKALLDPQGKAVSNSMKTIGFENISNVRIGKHITLEIEASSREEAKDKVNQVCSKIFSNPVMEGYEYEVYEEKE